MEPERTKRKIEYKWVIAAIGFVMVAVTLGFCSGNKSLYLKAITEALGFKRSLFTLSDSIRFVTTAVLNLLFGILILKFGAKKLIIAGILSLIVSCILYSISDTLGLFYVGGMFLGIGLAWCTTSMVGYVVAKWFKENRGTVMGAILAANGLGVAVSTQIISPMIHDATVAGGFGYRNAYRLTAVILAGVLALVILFFRDAPKGYVETGVKPTGKKKPSRAATWEGISFKSAVKKPYFWITAVCLFFTGAALQTINGVGNAHLEDVGLDTTFIAAAWSMHGLVLVLAKILAGVSFDKFGLRVTIFVADLMATVSIFMLSMVGKTSYALAFAFEILISFAMPLDTVMQPLIAADMFGERSYAQMMGLLVGVNTLGFAVGSPLTNLVYDLTGSYRGVLIVLGSVMAVITAAMQLTLRKSTKERARITAEREAKRLARAAEKQKQQG